MLRLEKGMRVYRVDGKPIIGDEVYTVEVEAILGDEVHFVGSGTLRYKLLWAETILAEAHKRGNSKWIILWAQGVPLEKRYTTKEEWVDVEDCPVNPLWHYRVKDGTKEREERVKAVIGDMNNNLIRLRG